MSDQLRTTTKPLNVVMVVDNAIVGDSRVIKSAMAVAKSGHKVTLLGTDLGKEKPVIPGVTVKLMPNLDPKTLTQKDSVIEKILFRCASIICFTGYRSKSAIISKSEQLGKQRASIKRHGGKKSPTGILLLCVFYFTKLVHTVRLRFSALKEKLHKKIRHLFANRKAQQQSKSDPHANSSRKDYPTINAHFERAFVQAIVDLEPDVIHSHDYKCVSVGALAKEQLLNKGKDVYWIYDAHEFLPGLAQYSEAWREAQCTNEATYIGEADLVITVSEKIAQMLQERHHLNHQPKVVLNAPTVRDAIKCSRNLRKDCGIDSDAPLAIYLGGVTPLRGLDVVVPALVSIPELHVCLVATRNVHVDNLEAKAAEASVIDRLHVVPYVAPNEIVDYIKTATVGLVPLLYSLNHASALPSKFYEYANAGIPIVGSDVEIVAQVLKQTNVGEVFKAGDDADFTRALQLVLSNPNQYSSNYANSGLMEQTWENQEVVLCSIYETFASKGHQSNQ